MPPYDGGRHLIRPPLTKARPVTGSRQSSRLLWTHAGKAAVNRTVCLTSHARGIQLVTRTHELVRVQGWIPDYRRAPVAHESIRLWLKRIAQVSSSPGKQRDSACKRLEACDPSRAASFADLDWSARDP